MVIVRLGLGLCRQNATTMDFQEPATSSMPWQSPVRCSSDGHKLTAEETTAVRGDPKPDDTPVSYRRQSLYPVVVDPLVTESHLEWRG